MKGKPMWCVVWNDEGKRLLSDFPAFGDYSVELSHDMAVLESEGYEAAKKLNAWLCGNFYCFVMAGCIFHCHGNEVTHVGTIERG